MTEKNDRAGLTIVIGLEGPSFALNSWLDNLRVRLLAHVDSVQFVIAASPDDQSIEQITERHRAGWVHEAGTSQAALARVASVHAAHPFVLTCTARNGLFPPAKVVETVWNNRHHADLLTAARFQKGHLSGLASFQGHLLRRVLSLPVRDVFSPCRLYRRDMLTALHSRLPQENGAVADLDLLLQIVAEGYQVHEVNVAGQMPVGAADGSSVWLNLRQVASLWRRRNSILSADYDDRAYDSIIPLQRYWQRQRFRFITELIAGEGAVLDVGCGSSRILSALPEGSVGIDILFRKLRYARRFPTALIHASGFHLPVADGAFSCVLCSQTIEHVPKTSPILHELCRALRPGGRLVIGTPDYAHWEWRFIEQLYAAFAPGGYADEHIAHYSREELLDFFQSRGFAHEATRYILRGELIMAFRKS
jgi:SAM-dependent methyltransferase